MVHVHGRRWAGATMPPEGKDNVKGQACLGCKRNSIQTKRYGFVLEEGFCHSINLFFDVSNGFSGHFTVQSELSL